MGYDLSNTAGTSLRFTGSGWDLALALARHYGWHPLGIPKPTTWDENKLGPWTDEYWINAGQQLTAPDAAALTTALDTAIAAPDFMETVITLKTQMTFDDPTNPADAEAFRTRLSSLATLTRQGPFTID